jgi:hypothetical protein
MKERRSMTRNKRTIAIILVAALTLLLLLTACNNNGGDTPTGDNSTPPGASSAPTETPGESNTPDTSSTTTEAPDSSTSTITPSESNTPDTSTPTETPRYNLPPYDETEKAVLDRFIADFGQAVSIDVNNTLDEIQNKYGQYLNVNISKDSVLTGIRNRGLSSYYHGKSDLVNPTGISPDAIVKVNEFLVSKGEEPLGISAPDLLAAHNEMLNGMHVESVPAILTTKENIAAFWLAASLFYDPDVPMADIALCYDIAMAFALSTTDPSKIDEKSFQDAVWIIRSDYMQLYGGNNAIDELNNR